MVAYTVYWFPSQESPILPSQANRWVDVHALHCMMRHRRGKIASDWTLLPVVLVAFACGFLTNCVCVLFVSCSLVSALVVFRILRVE